MITRLTITHEELQSSQRSASYIVERRLGETIQTTLCNETIELENFPKDTAFFYIDACLDKGGFTHEMRTEEECLSLISQALPQENAKEVFQAALQEKFVRRFAEITIEKA